MRKFRRRIPAGLTDEQSGHVDAEPLADRPALLAPTTDPASGQPLPDETRAALEPRFNHDISQVRIHDDAAADEAASSLNAEAFTLGPDIYFADGRHTSDQAGFHLLSHEIAHTIQSPDEAATVPVAVGSRTDTAEIEAGRAATDVTQGKPATIAPGSSRATTIRRFESTEHRDLGNEASGHKTTDINIGTDKAPVYLSYGEMVALAGDYFESLQQMRDLAKTQAGRDEMRWARWKALGSGAEPTVSDAVKTKVMDRYFGLAAKNISHFSAGGTANNSYEEYHLKALSLAFTAGAWGNNAKWTEAETTEAFGQHYLSDMFSAGHVRTERSAIKSWYEKKYPNSISQFITYMAGHMLTYLQGAHPYASRLGLLPSQSDLEGRINAIGGTALNAFSLGDIVSLACHDRDNLGLEVVSKAGVDKHGKPTGTASDFHYTAVGDSKLSLTSTTGFMAIAAMKASLKDLALVRDAGKAAASSKGKPDLAAAYTNALKSVQPYESETFIPKEDTSGVSTGNVTMNWHWGSFNAEMRDAVNTAIKDEIVKVLREKAAVQTDQNVKDALEDFAKHLDTQGIGAIETAIGVKAGP